ncbi:MAG: tail fiber domain-containing protein [Anaerolineales bacterium]|nr:tail fiber domain-containing protein [Anaerolineales bacterium]
MKSRLSVAVCMVGIALFLLVTGTDVLAQEISPLAELGTTFTYQGQLKQNGNLVNSNCDFEFRLYDALSGGVQIGNTQASSNVMVNNGVFTVGLDFGAGAFDGNARWLGISVRCPSGSGNFALLSPRQALTAAPYALALPGLYTLQNSSSPNIVGGFSGNSVSSGVVGATIGGGGASGSPNRVTDNYGTVGGGGWNTAGDNAGTANNASSATVSGGSLNVASGSYSTVGGGLNNTASGDYATVGGGSFNTVAGNYSFVVGRRANNSSNHPGVFLFADSNDLNFTSIAANEFAVRASGGFRFRTSSNLSTGCSLPAGSGTFSCTSDRAAKENFSDVDRHEILERLATLPIQTWNYKSQNASIRHIGPTAQDFYTAFGLGDDKKNIALVDADGIALVAIQGLYQRLQEQETQIASQQMELAKLKSQVADLEERLAALEQRAGNSPEKGESLFALFMTLGAVATLVGTVAYKRKVDVR